MKRLLKIIMLILLCFFVAGTLFVLIFNKGMNQIKKIEIKNIDLSKIEDGEYFGKYGSGRWQYEVKVVVSNREIKAIEILNQKSGFIDMNMYKQVNDEVINRILKKQSLRIDVVTGATINTKALLKAIENALAK